MKLPTPLESLTDSVERPLFNPGRRPLIDLSIDPTITTLSTQIEPGPARDIDEFSVTAIVMDGGKFEELGCVFALDDFDTYDLARVAVARLHLGRTG